MRRRLYTGLSDFAEEEIGVDGDGPRIAGGDGLELVGKAAAFIHVRDNDSVAVAHGLLVVRRNDAEVPFELVAGV